MRFREYLLEQEELKSFWDLVSALKLDAASETFHDALLPWINKNATSCIDRGIKNKSYRNFSHLKLYKNYVVKENNYSKKILTLNGFTDALEHELTAWRGGGGKYDPEAYTQNWTSFTLDKKRLKTFSEYDGTYASKTFSLPKRSEFWEVELKIKIKDILLYLDQGTDQEIIVPVSLAKQAKVI